MSSSDLKYIIIGHDTTFMVRLIILVIKTDIEVCNDHWSLFMWAFGKKIMEQ